MFSSLSFFTRYTSIIKENDEINLFGIAKYNHFNGVWEITQPIALMYKGLDKLISHFSR
jgi:hypothetical protein